MCRASASTRQDLTPSLLCNFDLKTAFRDRKWLDPAAEEVRELTDGGLDELCLWSMDGLFRFRVLPATPREIDVASVGAWGYHRCHEYIRSQHELLVLTAGLWVVRIFKPQRPGYRDASCQCFLPEAIN